MHVAKVNGWPDASAPHPSHSRAVATALPVAGNKADKTDPDFVICGWPQAITVLHDVDLTNGPSTGQSADRHWAARGSGNAEYAEYPIPPAGTSLFRRGVWLE